MSKKQCRWMTPLSLIALLASLSACVPGDFCEVVRAPIEFEAATAAQIVATDRAQAVAIGSQNAYGADHCDWAVN